MKTLILISLTAFALSACQTSNLKGRAHTGYEKYITQRDHKAFFVYQSPDGGFVYSYVYGRESRYIAYNQAQKNCNKQFDKVNFRNVCSPYAIDDIKVSSLSNEQIEELLREPGIAETKVDIKGTWLETNEKVIGNMGAERKGTRSLMIVSKGVNCTGQGKYVKGKFGTGELPEGVWSLTCNDGRLASGVYKAQGPNNGIGSGVDNQGRRLEFTYGPT